MSRLQLPRQTSTFISTYVPNEGEIFVDTTNDEVKADPAGGTTGGRALAWKDGTNLTAGPSSVTATGSSTARTLADWFQGIERGSVFPPAGDLFTAQGAVFWRNGERALYGGYATAYKGTNTRSDGASVLGSTGGGFNAFWQERSAQLGSLSLHGGIGVLGGSRKSDRYIYTDGVTYPVWITATVYAAGAIVGSRGCFYQTAAGGTSGATPPSHTSGSVSDGSVTWTFLDFSYTAPIGIAGAVLNDIVDGSGAWAAYFEAIRTSAGGTTYGTELDLGNEGSDVTNNPYSITPAGATIGHWVAAGRSASTPANPSTNAILIGKNNQTWNSGIVFEYQGITAGGYAIKYAAISDHAQGWFNSSGQEVFALYSTATANNERTKIVSGNSKIEFYSVGGVMATISSGASAGTAANEHINLIANAAGTGYASVTPHGTASNLGLRLLAKGTENIYMSGVAVRPITDDGTALGTAGARWSDLHLATGAVINYQSGNYTLTHSSNLLTASGPFSVGTSNSITAGTIELGAATDTTLSRSAAGILAVEGVDQVNVSTAQTISGVKTFSNATTGLSIASNTPRIRIQDSDAGSDEKIWTLGEGAGTQLLFRTRTDVDGAGATWLTVTRSGTAISSITFGAGLTIPGGTLITTNTALTNGAAAQSGTLTNAPAAGNPTKWIPINDNGTTRYIPAW